MGEFRVSRPSFEATLGMSSRAVPLPLGTWRDFFTSLVFEPKMGWDGMGRWNDLSKFYPKIDPWVWWSFNIKIYKVSLTAYTLNSSYFG